MKAFKGRTAIVTGGASGLGREISEQLGGLGTSVIVADLNEAGAREVAQRIVASGGRARAVHLDVTSEEEVRSLVGRTASEHGRLDYMFNIAGIAIQGEARDMGPEHWRRILDINLLGVLYGTTAAYERMVEQGSGHIVNMSSLLGIVGLGLSVAYATTKHAIVGLSTSLRAEGAGLGVKVSVVCPGFVQTGLYEAATITGADKDEFYAQVPFRRMRVDRAARLTLQGVAKNRGMIVFPLHARLLWLMQRLNPGAMDKVHGPMMQQHRKIRWKT